MATTRRLTAILAADVAGYSRLMGADEEGTHERLKAHLAELVHPKIEEHRGRAVKNTGDGFLAEFPSVVDAVRCAVEMQRGMVERNAGITAAERIEFRVGINLGDVIAEEHDIFGDGVNVAARLEALAEPGGICISGTVRDHIGDRFSHAFVDKGEQSLKNIARPVRVYVLRPEAVTGLPRSSVPIRATRRRRPSNTAIALAAATTIVLTVIGWRVWPVAGLSPAAVTVAPPIAKPFVAPRLSIVVLPFANLSDDPKQQYFTDGITEDLTTDLSQISNMLVISPDSAFTYKDKPVNAKRIGRDLGVRYVLEGSVQRSANEVRVNAQLIDAETDTHLWAERFDHDMGDLFALQNDITARIANSLDAELVAVEAARPTEHPDALDYILRGRAARLQPNSGVSYAEAIKLFWRALELDPQSAEAQSLLALALVQRAEQHMTSTATSDIEIAEMLSERALAAQPRSWRAHLAKGDVLLAQRQCEEAVPEFEATLALNPNSAPALNALALCKLWTGSIEEVIPLVEQAIRLSPRDPQIATRYALIGKVDLLQSRTDEAIPWLERARSANPEWYSLYTWLAAAYALKGETSRAAAELAEARRLMGKGSWSSIAGLRKGYWGVPKTRALYETTYFTGLRLAGLPEE